MSDQSKNQNSSVDWLVGGEMAVTNARSYEEERRRAEAVGNAQLYSEAKKEIAERARIETALRESEERLRLVARAASDVIWEIDIEKDQVWWSEAMQGVFGYTPEEIGPGAAWLREHIHPEDRDRVVQGMIEAIEGASEVWSDEFRYRRADGSYVCVIARAYLARGENGNALRMIGGMRDITQRKRAEQLLVEAMRQKEALYQFVERRQRANSLEEIYESALDAIVSVLRCERAAILLCDESGVMRFVVWRGLSDGYRKGTEGHSPWRPDDPDPRPVWVSDIREADLGEPLKVLIAAEGIAALAFIPLLISGSLAGKFMIYYGAPHHFDEGEIDLSLTIAGQLALGIERVRAEAALRIVSLLPAQNPSPVLRVARDGALLYANPAAVESFKEWDLRAGATAPRAVSELVESAWSAGQACTLEQIVGDRYYLVSIAPVFESDYANLYWNDITDRKQSEVALRESEERYRRLMRLLPVAVYTCEGPSGTITFYNDHAAKLWGRAPAIGHDTDERFCGSFRLWRTNGSLLPHDQAPMALALRDGRSFRNEEVVIERPDATRITVLVNVDPVRDNSGRVVGAINAFHDTTLLKEFQDAVLQSEQRFRSLVSVITDVPWTTDAAGRFVEPQPAWAEYTGQSWEELRGFGWTNALHPDDRETIWAVWQRACEARSLYQSQGRIWHARSRQYRYFQARATPIMNPDGSVRQWVGACNDVDDQKRAKERLEVTVAERTQELQRANAVLLRDMEERRKLEEQLLQVQKMEGIGTLAGGVAHDFNNILNIIQGYASLLSADGSQNKQTGECLTIINETIQRGSSLVHQLLTLARKGSSERESVNVNAVIEGLIALITQTFPKTMELRSSLEASLPPIMADKNQIEQALLNLCVNARDAMAGGGTLILKTQSVDGKTLGDLGAIPEERYVCIEVRDTGTGINESIRKRIFEPFFTTKDKGQGTGLGLSVVYGIVKSHDGLIDVESKVDRGTIFRLYLPAAPATWERKTSGAAGKSALDIQGISNGSSTILLVEDEKNMLYLLEKVFLRRGYQIFTATDGEKALEIFLGHKDIIDVVLLDVGLPKVSGRDVLSELKQASPNVKICVVSGYLEPELQSEIERMGVKHFLRKPYRPDEVVTTIQSLIETKP